MRTTKRVLILTLQLLLLLLILAVGLVVSIALLCTIAGIAFGVAKAFLWGAVGIVAGTVAIALLIDLLDFVERKGCWSE